MGVKQYLEIGKITTTHGIKGEMRILPWCDDCNDLSSLTCLFFDSLGKDKRKVEQIRIHKNILIVKLAKIDTIEEARSYRDRVVYANREELPLPDGSYFIQDLLGSRVLDADDSSRCYGILREVLQTGANDVYRIVDEEHYERLAPAIPDVLDRIEIAAGEIYIRPLKGLFDDED